MKTQKFLSRQLGRVNINPLKYVVVMLVLCLCAMQQGNAQRRGNPVLRGYNADPDIEFFNSRYYLYPTGGVEFKAWSSTDLTNWAKEGVIFDLSTQCSWAKFDGWAPHVVCRNSRYYFYYAAEAKIGVAVGNTPIGPFTDIGHPLIGTDPYIEDIIDPAVFVDADGQAYIYYGGSAQSKMVIRKLATDMVSFIGEPILSTPLHYTEAPHMLKRGDTYYLSYSNGSWTNSTYNIRYVTSKSPVGPWDYKGIILGSAGQFSGNGHASIIKRPGTNDEYYIAYHRYQNGDYKTRRVAIDKVHFKEGYIQKIIPTWEGVPALSSGIAEKK